MPPRLRSGEPVAPARAIARISKSRLRHRRTLRPNPETRTQALAAKAIATPQMTSVGLSFWHQNEPQRKVGRTASDFGFSPFPEAFALNQT